MYLKYHIHYKQARGLLFQQVGFISENEAGSQSLIILNLSSMLERLTN